MAYFIKNGVRQYHNPADDLALDSNGSESKNQEMIFVWAQIAKCKFPELALLFHIPNGGSRNKLEAYNLKKQGVKAGVPDLCLPVARGKYHALYIELKAGKNKTTEKQDEWLVALNAQGNCASVCYGWKVASEKILNYLMGKE